MTTSYVRVRLRRVLFEGDEEKLPDLLKELIKRAKLGARLALNFECLSELGTAWPVVFHVLFIAALLRHIGN